MTKDIKLLIANIVLGPGLLGTYLYTHVQGFYNLFAFFTVMILLGIFFAQAVVLLHFWIRDPLTSILLKRAVRTHAPNKAYRGANIAVQVVNVLVLVWISQFIIAGLIVLSVMLAALLVNVSEEGQDEKPV